MRRILPLLLAALALPAAVLAVPYSITYTDGAGEGFNDATAVGSTTLGQQRKDVLVYALDYWTSRLSGSQTIQVEASFDPLGGTAGSALLAQASPTQFVFLAAGGPRTNTFYPIGMANQINSIDNGIGIADIEVQFNTDVDNATVLGNVNWYYGLDENAGTHVSMVRTALHELGHGFGFLDCINSGDGTFLGDPFPCIYDTYLRQGSGPGTALTSLGAGARATALTSDNIFWEAGTNVATSFGGQPRMYAPNPYEPGSSVSHFREATFTPEELMEPVLSTDFLAVGLTDDAFKDMGYALTGPTVLPEVAFTVSPGSIVAENAGVQNFTVTRTGDTSEAVSFNISLSGTASAGVDYSLSQSSFSIGIGATTASFTITPVADGVDEGPVGLSGETVVVAISRVLKAGYGTNNTISFNLNDSAADVHDWSMF